MHIYCFTSGDYHLSTS
ncbi:unnamed protein product [Gulo gulo]|uniref:Uncharacterized protein n=1 Tax=Gulo gulo TaxID=48420 RepID=A0A9X9PUY0_GULGU|nr:unnamed protein product [Gulo gulo]